MNEFVKAGLTEVPSDKIHPPRVGESPVAFECLVDNVIETGTEGGAGQLVIARIIKIHIQKQYLDNDQKLDTTKLDMVGRMGGSWYCRASGASLFEIPKPLKTKGMGIDELPLSVRNSDVLTGNNLGRLGNIEQLPTDEEVVEWAKSPMVKDALKEQPKDRLAIKTALHQLAKKQLENGDTEGAIKTLLVFEGMR